MKTRFISRATVLGFLIALFASAAIAGAGLPLQPTRHVAFDTDEATWVSLDLSPDGRTIVFDILGDLYAMDV